ncbi:hypothetical protein [Neorhodopirellula pilleata]|uniref:hypothetical protein n=1 Tax=Neorhodopirellula pilleata TaxID=2714738 RepID=UPI0011B75F92|nr:hypothetical protein [Neorhodopirellula pilleata]
MAELVAGWLAEWLGGRAIGIMGIEGGLSNFFYRFDWRRYFADHENALTRQKTVKMQKNRAFGGPANRRCNELVSQRKGRSVDVRVVASGRKTTENTVSISPMVLEMWELLLSRKPPLEKVELCKINRLSAPNTNLDFSTCRPTGRTVGITKTWPKNAK